MPSPLAFQMITALSAPPEEKRFPSLEYDTVYTLSLCPCPKDAATPSAPGCQLCADSARTVLGQALLQAAAGPSNGE